MTKIQTKIKFWKKHAANLFLQILTVSSITNRSNTIRLRKSEDKRAPQTKGYM